MSTARSAAEAIGGELKAGDLDFALRRLITAITDLRAIVASGDRRALDDFVAPAGTTGSERWDTLLAASIGRELRRAGLARPGWTMPSALRQWWFVGDPPPLLFARTIQRTPPDLACLGIWLDAKAFDTA